MSNTVSHQQLPLDLSVGAARDRGDLIVTQSNRQAVEFLESWPDWPSQIVVLAGPTGAGKTHLAHIWASRCNAKIFSTEHLGSISQGDPCNIVLEDVSADSLDETGLFHLINTVKSTHHYLLIASRYWPGDWDVQLPDLSSRIKTSTLLELHEPDDPLLLGVLAKLFSDRQLQVEPAVLEYLVLRMERSLASAQALVEQLDRMSLMQKRAVTKPLAAQALRELGLQD